MLNLSTNQKPMFEIAQVLTNTMKDITKANLQLINTVSTAYFDACTTCCKLGEETSQQASKTASSK